MFTCIYYSYLKEEWLSCHIKDIHFDIVISHSHLRDTKVYAQSGHVFGDESLFTETLD